jgi:SNF2 family DNA or RNA helicase
MRHERDLHDYQCRAVEHILSKNKSALWLDMGLGKTVTTLTAIDTLMYDTMDVHKVLIICPLRVANTVWHTEAKNWSHLKGLKFSIVTGSVTERLAALHRSVDIYVINRENIPWLVEHMGKKWNFDMVVIDESSSFKTHSSQRFKALKKVLPLISRMVQLTGTPSPNGYMDIWSQIYLMDMGTRLGRTISLFRDRYFNRDYMGFKYELRDGSVMQIQDKIQDLILSMSSDDYLQLPDYIPSVLHNKLEGKLLKSYRDFEKQMVLDINKKETVTAVSAAALSNKLLQFCSGAVYDELGTVHHIHDLKIDTLKEIIENNPNDNILVAYNYKHELSRLQIAFPNAVVLDKKGEAVEKWNKGEIKILLAHPASAGHGLNLQHGGSLIIWFGFVWSLELYQQFNARLYRQGQKNSVRVLHIAVGDIENHLMNTLMSKEVTQDQLLSALK